MVRQKRNKQMARGWQGLGLIDLSERIEYNLKKKDVI